jgi:hypothetical protein
MTQIVLPIMSHDIYYFSNKQKLTWTLTIISLQLRSNKNRITYCFTPQFHTRAHNHIQTQKQLQKTDNLFQSCTILKAHNHSTNSTHQIPYYKQRQQQLQMIDETKLLIQSSQLSKANNLLHLINNYHISTVLIDTTNKKLKIY